MDKFKIEHFERDNPGETFPRFESLDPVESSRLLVSLARRAGIIDPGGVPDLALRLYSMARVVEDADADAEGFDLSSVVSELGLTPQAYVYIDWQRDSVDRMRFSDLSRYFDDIWYPGPDDIAIFDDALSWILYVTHYGAVEVLIVG